MLLKLVVWTEGGLPDAPRSPEEVTTFATNAAKVAEFIRHRYQGMYHTRPDPNSPEIMTPAAQALFAMPKYSAW